MSFKVLNVTISTEACIIISPRASGKSVHNIFEKTGAVRGNSLDKPLFVGNDLGFFWP